MNILFVTHEIGHADCIAIGYLSAIAKEGGHKTFFCTLHSCDFVETVVDIQPDVVAYSVNIVGYDNIVKANKAAKKRCNFVSIMGGPQATFSPDTFEESGMDAYCVGEGEYPFKEFLKCISEKKSFGRVDNLITKEGANPIRDLIKNLDDLPKCDRDLTISNSFLKNISKKTFYAARGCFFKCSYCCNSYYRKLYKGKGKVLRRFSVERIIREIEDVKTKYKTDFIKFGDDMFVWKADDWLKEFSEKYSQRINIPFNCFLRIDAIDDEVLYLLKKAGCHSVHVSVDSLSKDVREDVLQRKMKNIDMIDRLKKIRSYGIKTWVNFMLAAPESSLKNDLDTILFSKKAKITYPSYSTTVPMKRTELYDLCLDRGYIDENHNDDMSGCTARSGMNCFSDKEKNIRYNIFLVGAMITKLPYPFDRFCIKAIQFIPPNHLFEWIRKISYNYYITHKIFKTRR